MSRPKKVEKLFSENCHSLSQEHQLHLLFAMKFSMNYDFQQCLSHQHEQTNTFQNDN